MKDFEHFSDKDHLRSGGVSALARRDPIDLRDQPFTSINLESSRLSYQASLPRLFLFTSSCAESLLRMGFRVISLIVPTRNRANTLRRVATSYFEQKLINEIIFVIDGGTDDSRSLLQEIALGYPKISLQIIENSMRKGASASRNIGVATASNEFILFCDDDEYLEPGYAATCLQKLHISGAAVVSGRRVYMRVGETPGDAVRRFGNGVRGGPVFRPLICEYINGARFIGDIYMPFTNAIILTKKQLLIQNPFDVFYSKGNGYREETDYQMNLFTKGMRVLITNDCHSIHLPLSEVRGGGQRASRIRRLYWSIYYTRYFFRKYWATYAPRVGVRSPYMVALGYFTIFAIYRETLRPALYALWNSFQRRPS